VSGKAGLPNWRELGLPPDAPYINAGVLLMNLTAWRARGYGAKVVEYAQKTAAINRYADQDGINALLCRECKLLDLRWNVPAYIEFDRLFRPLEDSPVKARVAADRGGWLTAAGIVHFIGNRKPWGRGLASRSQAEWLWYCRRSGWFRGDPWGYARLVAPIWADAVARRTVRAARGLASRA
jgi:lipopolysaccharide biosynthesis glycosyltransferase